VEVWRGGVRVDRYGDDGIPTYGGEVDVDPGKQVRRVLSGLKVDATDEMWDLLSPPGTELRVFRGFRYLNGETEVVPVGVFVVPNLSETYGGDWSGQVGSASDRMILVQRARFTRPRAMPVGMRIADAIGMLVGEVLGTASVLASSTAVTGPGLVYERDRGKAIEEMAASIGADVYCAPDGSPMVVDTPQLAATSVWTVNGVGDDSILYKADRDRSFDRVYSGVVASPAQIDGAAPFDPVEVWDEDPTSPTYYLGPFGKVPYFLTSPHFQHAGQAWVAASTLLPQVTGLRAQLTLEAETNPALEGRDTITAALPPRQRGATAVTERHLVGPFSVPLTPDGTQRIATLSAQPDVPASA
jgi:hypothetical protein